jgi:charged multivesicular body protein 2A
MTLEEQLKANKRLIARAIREMDREKLELERDQKRLEIEIKKLAQANQMSAVRVAAKDLVRTRAHITKMYQMRSNLQGLNLKMQTMKSTAEMASAMGKMSKAMKSMNKKMNIPKMKELMLEFQRQEAAMEMTQEMNDE